MTQKPRIVRSSNPNSPQSPATSILPHHLPLISRHKPFATTTPVPNPFNLPPQAIPQTSLLQIPRGKRTSNPNSPKSAATSDPTNQFISKLTPHAPSVPLPFPSPCFSSTQFTTTRATTIGKPGGSQRSPGQRPGARTTHALRWGQRPRYAGAHIQTLPFPSLLFAKFAPSRLRVRLLPWQRLCSVCSSSPRPTSPATQRLRRVINRG